MKTINPIRSEICARKIRFFVKRNPKIKTQEKFAELMDVDVRTVKRWMTKGVDSLVTIKKIADVLEISDLDLIID